ncbi:MAG TPA: sugar transferase [Bacteroidales bacterium]|jgi:exopolysaccharide biosynthesis polyprenyl glycosylphosphotransferase|nr:sugar transferase [Bacteroidales bacterium]
MNKRLQLIKYLISDIITAIAAWCVYYYYWKYSLLNTNADFQFIDDLNRLFLPGAFCVPFFWLFIYYLGGYYNDVIRKSRLLELWQTFGNIFMGSVILYLLTQIHETYLIELKGPLSPFLTLVAFQFIFTYIPRLIITTITTHKVHSGKIGFNTILIGSNSKAFEIFNEVTGQKRSNGNIFIGFVSVNKTTRNVMEKYLPYLGKIEDIHNIIRDKNVEEVIIAIEYTEHDMINLIINKLINVDVEIKAIPSLYDILTGRVRMSSILGTPLISVSHNPMPAWQQNTKAFLDRFIAAFALIITFPISVFLAIGIKLSSKGPVFYSHERVGRYGKPFYIYKFRSMYVDAEKDGPELSSKSDDRVTPFGRFMRRTRLDEIPNFINVLRGEMSLVGPRPERKHYIEQIVQTAPHYLHLLKVKPGITSWGQVKYGYAENVDQMIQRLKYDLLYLDNMSLFVDFKILIYTFLTIIKRQGI